MRIAYHLVPEPWFRAWPAERDYLPETYEADGFAHLTHGVAPVLVVANTFYRADPRHYLLLTIDLDRVAADARYDDPNRQFPHVFGPIDRAAILDARPLRRAEDGTFLSVGSPCQNASSNQG